MCLFSVGRVLEVGDTCLVDVSGTKVRVLSDKEVKPGDFVMMERGRVTKVLRVRE